MQVNHKLPEIQGPLPSFMTTWVVLGPKHPNSPGKIKTVRISANVTSGLVDAKYTYSGGDRVNGIRGITIHTEEEANGTRFLKELYEECGRMDNWNYWLQHQQACAEDREVAPFPDSRLPPCVLAWRAREGSGREKFVIPEDDAPEMPEPKPQPQRRRAAAEAASE